VTGTIVQINVSPGGIPKRAIAAAELTEAGIVGDAWRFPFHGGQRKAILLITTEGIDEVDADTHTVRNAEHVRIRDPGGDL
jgi:MOSC domain-containing protein YiiM